MPKIYKSGDMEIIIDEGGRWLVLWNGSVWYTDREAVLAMKIFMEGILDAN